MRRMQRVICGVLGLAMLLLAPIGAAARAATPVPTPDNDPFYVPPSNLATTTPGTILRARAVNVAALGLPLPFRSWQLLYRSTDSHGAPEATVATVLEPESAAPPGGRPLLAYQPAEDALTRSCAPSYEMRQGTEPEELEMVLPLLKDWAIVVADYEGPQSQWAAGAQAAHGVLDAIRAAEAFAPAGLRGAATSVGLWGYSGGGQATGWVAELAPGYAPELNIKGAAYGGAPADVGRTFRYLDGGAFAGIAFAGAVGLSRAYPEMDLQSLLNAKGRAMAAQVGTECIDQFAFQYPYARISDYTSVPDPLAVPRVKQVVTMDNLGQRKPTTPLYIYNATHDELNPIAAGDALVSHYCSEGVTVDYERILVGEHISPVVTNAAQAVSYLADRFAGKPAPSTCPG